MIQKCIKQYTSFFTIIIFCGFCGFIFTTNLAKGESTQSSKIIQDYFANLDKKINELKKELLEHNKTLKRYDETTKMWENFVITYAQQKQAAQHELKGCEQRFANYELLKSSSPKLAQIPKFIRGIKRCKKSLKNADRIAAHFEIEFNQIKGVIEIVDKTVDYIKGDMKITEQELRSRESHKNTNRDIESFSKNKGYVRAKKNNKPFIGY